MHGPGPEPCPYRARTVPGKKLPRPELKTPFGSLWLLVLSRMSVEDSVALARIAESAERYEDMAKVKQTTYAWHADLQTTYVHVSSPLTHTHYTHSNVVYENCC